MSDPGGEGYPVRDPLMSPFEPEREKVNCYGCGKKIVHPPAAVCTYCLMIGKVTEAERAALEADDE